MSESNNPPARILYADGRERPTAPLDGKHFKLAEMQQIVGGYIEVLLAGYLPDSNGTPMLIIGDEDAKRKDSPVNDKATELWLQGRGGPGIFPDAIRGDVLVCREDMVE